MRRHHIFVYMLTDIINDIQIILERLSVHGNDQVVCLHSRDIGRAYFRPRRDIRSGKRVILGCLLLRPSHVMAMDSAEIPTIIEDLMAAMGAEPVVYAQRNECCGGYLTLEDKAVPEKRARAILENARAAGADTVVTACPLCLYNLRKQEEAAGVQVKYVTELLAESLGVKEGE